MSMKTFDILIAALLFIKPFVKLSIKPSDYLKRILFI